jgi:nicotinamide phosphoribosyltransferase
VSYLIYNQEDSQYYALYFSASFISERGGYSDNKYYTLESVKLVDCEVTHLTPEQKGSIEILWEIFGGTVTEQGYKLLDSHIGLIYGDSITMAVAEEVFLKLAAKGFASTNVVFGIGSYSLQHVTRDSFGMAVKATYAEVDGKGYELFKDPKTDGGMKKSAKGLLRVEKEGDNYVLYDQQTPEQEKQGELKTVFLDGKLVKETSLSEIRQRLWEN